LLNGILFGYNNYQKIYKLLKEKLKKKDLNNYELVEENEEQVISENDQSTEELWNILFKYNSFKITHIILFFILTCKRRPLQIFVASICQNLIQNLKF